MTIQLIDNSFFKLSSTQARELSIDGKLPREGYEKKADPAKLAQVNLVYRQRREGGKIVPCEFKATDAQKAWIKRTPLSWWNGAPVENGWTWALHLYFSP